MQLFFSNMRLRGFLSSNVLDVPRTISIYGSIQTAHTLSPGGIDPSINQFGSTKLYGWLLKQVTTTWLLTRLRSMHMRNGYTSKMANNQDSQGDCLSDKKPLNTQCSLKSVKAGESQPGPGADSSRT